MDYDLIAPYYDLLVGDRSAEITYLKNLLSRFKPDAKTLLDIGCGTGEVMHDLADLGLTMTGLDVSSAMLAVATKKLPGVRLLQGDMRDFNLEVPFDVIICTRDSLSQLMELGEWQKVFSSVQRHLANGAVFIFDVSSAARLIKLCSAPPVSVQFSNGHIDASVKKAPSTYFNWEVDINIDVPPEHARSEHGLVIETAFSIEEIMSTMDAFFIESVTVLDEAGQPATDQSNKLYFVCR